MAVERLQINPSVLTWARKRAGLSLDEAKHFGRIDEWESGASSPTYAQLEGLASGLKLPISVFFFPEPPDVPDVKKSFRTLPDAELESIPSRVRLLVSKATAFQLNLAELTGSKNPAERQIIRDLRLSIKDNIATTAEKVRDYLGLSLEAQQQFKTDDDALKAWRDAFQAVGVFVFKDAFRTDDFSGFCLYDEIFPLIYVNNSSTKTRQIFTLFHELAHLLFQTSGIDTLSSDYIDRIGGDQKAIEVFCNAFAAEFLLPEKELAQAMKGRKHDEATATELANRFHVSREVIFRRFLDQGKITQQTYREATTRWAQQRGGAGAPGGDYFWTKLAYLGRDYVSLALDEYRRNRISETQLANFLDVKPKSLAGLEEHFERGAL
ncbi:MULTISPECIES: ImmA/IrrE family metallo-endopeptidase [unclassified Bradyrhizobium]|uniref:helix-turn-helix domain-containing protein n=1 Tax=unclassified Bradyrhizobium TaxID=2631580 RepID=UPI002915EBDB|nr:MULTISPECIES: ImmA/IrrE family metallo-endopeptidase [unclassified Bradyrhizobium]